VDPIVSPSPFAKSCPSLTVGPLFPPPPSISFAVPPFPTRAFFFSFLLLSHPVYADPSLSLRSKLCSPTDGSLVSESDLRRAEIQSLWMSSIHLLLSQNCSFSFWFPFYNVPLFISHPEGEEGPASLPFSSLGSASHRAFPFLATPYLKFSS